MRSTADDLTTRHAPAAPKPQAGDVVAVANAAGAGRFVILCDHASNAVPEAYADLGLGPEALTAHIAWDPGALGVAREIARRLDAPLVHSLVSRLVVDCNRDPGRADLIAESSETFIVAGNRGIGERERSHRIATWHEPYHAAIEALVAGRLSAGRPTTLVAIHSFTPVYRGVARPWEVGILFGEDRSLADRLIPALRDEGLVVGENQPYSPADGVYYTLHRHATQRGLASVMIEIRNDLIRGAVEQDSWARFLGAALASGVSPAGEAGGATTGGTR